MSRAAVSDSPLKSKYPWLVAQSTWDRLHYVKGVNERAWRTWWDRDEADMIVTAACGRRFLATLPGIFSRMGTPRCRQCCQALGIEPGNGAPMNESPQADAEGKQVTVR